MPNKAHEETILVIGDIHANDAALAAVFGDAYRRYPGQKMPVWFLGDLFGRGPKPGSAYHRLLMENPEAMVQGNHEGGLTGRYTSIRFDNQTSGLYNEHDWEVLLLHREELFSQDLLVCNEGNVVGGPVADFIAELPVVSVPRPSIYMIHGGRKTPFSPPDILATFFTNLIWDYVKESTHADYTIDAIKWVHETDLNVPEIQLLNSTKEPPQLILVGHYHMRFFYNSATGDWHSPVTLDSIYSINTELGHPIVLSPGSVGFPREEERDASYAVLTLQDGRPTAVTFHTCAYDRQTVRDQMVRKGYPDQTVQRLRLEGETEDVIPGMQLAEHRNCSPQLEDVEI